MSSGLILAIIGTPASKQYDLERFVTAQEIAYTIALEEIRSGRKKSHWIWYIFPQQKGKKDELGHSKNSKYYGLDGIDEACAYLAHPILETGSERYAKCYSHMQARDPLTILWAAIQMF